MAVPDPQVRRRTLLVQALAAGGLAGGLPLRSLAAQPLWVENVTRLYPVRVARIVGPRSTAAIASAVRDWEGTIAVGGGRFSMGGQIAIAGGLHIDTRDFGALVWLEPQERRVRVQAGMRWRDLQDHLDPHGLSVRTMQSYSNFTVGGSVSVNVHGRYVGHGAIAESVRALQIVLPTGAIVEASRTARADLFAAAIGGYGAVGVITEVELALDLNEPLERQVQRVPLADYPAYFQRQVQTDTRCVMHNADLLPGAWEHVDAISWLSTDKPLTVHHRLVPRNQAYPLEQKATWAVSELPVGNKLHEKIIRPAMLHGPLVAWRNYEASLDVASLEPASREHSTYALQEYFVPVAGFLEFVRDLRNILRSSRAQVLNVSIRHAPADAVSLLAWAREEVFCFVLYYKQGTSASAQAHVGDWTRQLIDVALKRGGTYYLPYQRHATQAQFDAAYPGRQAFVRVKRRYDPAGKMDNELWRQYL